MLVQGRQLWSGLILVIVVVATGCACNERLTIHNRAPSDIRVQVALPWPSYKFTHPRGCQFDAVIAPGAEWSTASAKSAERTDLALSMANGPSIIRVKPLGSMSRPWRAFDAGHDDRVRAEVRQDEAGQLQLWLLGTNDEWKTASTPEVDFFGTEQE